MAPMAATGWDGLVIGVDLDMTLVDTSEAMTVALTRVNQQLGTDIDVGACVAAIGAPQREQLARWVPGRLLDEAMRVLAEAFVADGLPRVRALPGARRLLGAVSEGGGAVTVVTTRRSRLAAACLRWCGLPVGGLVGGLSATAKGDVLRACGASCYIGDHPLDMAAAAAARVAAIGVTTGFHDARLLTAAGADLILADLAGLGLPEVGTARQAALARHADVPPRP
jgi:phosphoglycolate phosphatase